MLEPIKKIKKTRRVIVFDDFDSPPEKTCVHLICIHLLKHVELEFIETLTYNYIV